MNLLNVLGSIQWDPEIRNILSLAVGFLVLCGSIYLLLATNLGARLGLLIALAALFGWIASMGVVWWMYGIGMKGEAAHWQVLEVNIGDLSEAGVGPATTLTPPEELPDPLAVLDDHPELVEVVIPEGQEGKVPSLGELVEADPSLAEELGLRPDDLGGWELLLPSNKQRGDAVASADAILGPSGNAYFTGTGEYKVLDAFSEGGKPNLDNADCKPRVIHPVWEGCWERVTHKLSSIWHWSHPIHYAIVQVQPVVPVCEEGQTSTDESPCVVVEEGVAAPPPVPNPNEPVYSVIMVRDLGDLRFPAAMVTLVFTVLFLVTCWRLHARDKLVAAHRAATAT